MRSNSNRHSVRRNVLLTAAVLAAVSQSPVALAGDCFWDGTIDNNWSVSPNWTNGTPTATDVAKFDAFGGVARSVIVVDSLSAVESMFIDGVPPPGAYEFQSFGNAQLFVGGDLTIAGIAANPTPVTFNNLNLDAGRLVLGANGTLNVAGATTLHAANGLEVFGVLNWQAGAIIQSFGSTTTVNPGGVVNLTAGGRGLGDGVTLNINNGSFTSDNYFDIGSSLDAGNGPAGTLSVSNGATYRQTAGATPIWGYQPGDFATVDFDSGASGTLSSGVDIAINGGAAIVNILDGATLHVDDHMTVGEAPPNSPLGGTTRGGAMKGGGTPALNAGSSSPITIDGGTLTVNGPANFRSGASVNLYSGGLDFRSDATFSTGSSFNDFSGFSAANGMTLAFDGGIGSVEMPAGVSYALTNGMTLRITNGGDMELNCSYYIAASVGGGMTGTMLVQDPFSTITSTATGASGVSIWSFAQGDQATITFANSGVGNYNAGLAIGAQGGAATVNISSSARLSTASLLVGRSSGASDGVNINVNGGSLLVSGPATLRNGATVNYSAGSLNIAGLLTTQGNAQMVVAAGANRVPRVAGIIMSDTSKLDLNDNEMIVGTLTPKANVIAFVRTARNGGAWNGTSGITSTAAKNHAQHITTLGVLSGTEYNSVGGTGIFSGQSYFSGDTLVKYTYYGDTDFNGKIDGSDYARIDGKFNQQTTQGNIGGWLNGDSDYNGKIDGGDYALIDAAFNAQGNTVLRAMQYLSGDDRSLRGMNGAELGMVLAHFEQFGDAYGQVFLSAVPEPTTAAFGVTLGSLTLLRRRRRI